MPSQEETIYNQAQRIGLDLQGSKVGTFADSFANFLNSPLTVSENILKFSGFPSEISLGH